MPSLSSGRGKQVPRFRIAILWLTAIFVVAGSTFGFAKVGHVHRADSSSVTHPESTPDADEADEATENESPDSSTDGSSADRPHNHGFFVSQAAQCEDVADPDTPGSPSFTAPADCTGSARGEYVSSVAQSDLGKKDHSHGHGGGSEGS